MADGLHHLLDAKRQLLLAISHELRSPLTRARLNAELVDASQARDALLHDLAEMRDLVTDLLESERLASGHIALHTEPTDLNAVVRELVATQFGAGRITLALAAELPTITLDATRIRLLLRNLIDNALRHGAGAAAPAIVMTALDGDALLLTVRDHGPGVDEAQLGRLAQAFYRPDSARQRATGGVGLGLYLCRLVAQAHGGSLRLCNADPGLQVEVRLPLLRP
jgi:signal transduction histidine kinase